MRVTLSRLFALPGLVASLLVLPGPVLAAAECTDPSHLCLAESSAAKWAPETKVTDAERKRRSSKSTGTLNLTIEGGRGSLFVNGRYAGTAPAEDLKVPTGPNDIQVRDGKTVLAWGVLTVPAEGVVSITVRHP